jgi:lysophospholipase L1-like esterase
VHVRFRGTGLDLRLKDYGGGTPETTNYYDVTIDGGEPTLLEVSPGQELYRLVSGLSHGEHQLELFKRVEAAPGGKSGAGKAQILGFVLHGNELLPAKRPERRLEFVGDSITCGYGNELETTNPDAHHYTSRNSNGHLAYGAVTASLLGAQYSAVAYSGRGMSRNFGGGGGQLLPDMYLDSVPEDAAAGRWQPAQYVPDAVIINLGTNDFSTTGVDRALFVHNYTAFLATLRGYYPNAALVAALGPMLSDSYPPGEKAWTNAQADVQRATLARVQAGDQNVHFLAFSPQTAPYGEDWHPTRATHRKMAEQLSTSLKRILGW